MFYSQTFLARKGPLGTVWCAAHLQHKLKKSHYTSTDISSTVDRIMYPEVPIALRMSSHLLLGVVRIYSKQVDYLHHDCNAFWVSMKNTFSTVEVDLVENATQAQFNAVTLPETYQLDAIDVDIALSLDDMVHDNHLKTHEEITLTEQYSSGGELYVRIIFDDDITPDLSRSEASPLRGNDPMETNNPPQESVSGDRAVGDGDDRHGRFGEESSLPDIPDEIEVLRDYRGNDDSFLPPEDQIFFPEPNASPLKNTPEKEVHASPLEHMSTLQMQSPHASPQHSGPSAPPGVESLGALDSFLNVTSPNLSLGPTPQDLSLRPTPPPEKPHRNLRKRKHFFDESLVLKNKDVKKALNDTSDLVKKRKKLPCSALDMWRFRNNITKEHIFSESLISGFCAELQSLSSTNVISVKTHLVLPEDIQPEARVAESPVRIPNDDMEIERLRSPYIDPEQDLMHELMPSPPQFTPQRSPGNAQTSSSPGIPELGSELPFGTTIDSVSEPRFGTTIDSESDRGMFTGSASLRDETPFTDFDEHIDGSNAPLSDIPEMRDSAELDELSFLEQDDNTPPDSQEQRQSDTMSVRTRAVAQYLKNHSPLSKYSGSSTEELSLNKVLEGRSRKLSARMFYETLVLKDYGLVDVQQEEPFGDIILKLTPLTMAKI